MQWRVWCMKLMKGWKIQFMDALEPLFICRIVSKTFKANWKQLRTKEINSSTLSWMKIQQHLMIILTSFATIIPSVSLLINFNWFEKPFFFFYKCKRMTTLSHCYCQERTFNLLFWRKTSYHRIIMKVVDLKTFIDVY